MRGFRIGFARGYRLPAESTPTYTLTGMAAVMRLVRKVAAASGSYALSGKSAALTATETVVAPSAGAFEPFPQYTINNDTKPGTTDTGMTGTHWSGELNILWQGNYDSKMLGLPEWGMGDWTDAEGVQNDITKTVAQTGITFKSFANGGLPSTFAASFQAGQYVDFSIPTLVDKWLTTGHNKGVYIRTTGSGFMMMAGRLYVDGAGIPRPPTLLVTTTTGAFTLNGMLGGFQNNSTSQLDTSVQARCAVDRAFICHFKELASTVTGTVTSATLRLWVVSKSTSSATNLFILEANPPYVWVGGGGRPVVWGAAKEAFDLGAGEENEPALRAQPGIVFAGDFKFNNWWDTIRSDGMYTWDSTSLPPCGDTGNQLDARTPVPWVSGPAIYSYHGQLEDDLEVPYPSKKVRWWFLYHGRTGVTAGPRYARRTVKPIVGDSSGRIDESTGGWTELYSRAYVKFEGPYYATTTGIKHGMGFAIWYGFANSQGGWTSISGNSGSIADGKAQFYAQGETIPPPGPGLVSDPNGQWVYRGHALRGHSLTGPNENPYPTDRNHQGYVKLALMPSNLGLEGIGYPFGSFGSEETVPCGPTNFQATVFKQDRTHCLEAYVKLNTVRDDPTFPATGRDQWGNGIANSDGIMRIYVDGVLAWERTGMRFIRNEAMKIEGPMLDSMHGGVDAPAQGHNPTHNWNHYICATRYIGPNPEHKNTRFYPAGVDAPAYVQASTGDLSALGAQIGITTATPNTWIDTGLKPDGAWAVRSMIYGARDAITGQVGGSGETPGNLNADAADTITNSNGIALDPTTWQCFWTGGGHGGYPGNEVYCADFEKIDWFRLNDPSPMVYAPINPGLSNEVDNWEVLDGTPKSSHSYDGIAMVPGERKFYMIHGAPWPQGGYIGDLWTFDIDAKVWTKITSINVSTGGTVSQPMSPLEAYEPHMYWVPSRGRFLIGWRRFWRWYDPATNTVYPLITAGADIGLTAGCVTDTGVYQFWTNNSTGVGNVDFLSFDNVGLAASAAVTPANFAALGATWNQDVCYRWNNYLWDPVRRMVIAWSNNLSHATTKRGKRVFAIDFNFNGLGNRLFEFVQPTGAWFPVCQSLGTFSRFVYVEQWDAYLGLNNTATANGWTVFKPGAMTQIA
jgi:hypothetical protein